MTVFLDTHALPWLHGGDQAARLLVATARAHPATLITRDREILAYADAGSRERPAMLSRDDR